MTKQELIEFINDDITVSGSLPIKLDDKEISRVIDMEKRMVYKDWPDTVEQKYAVMNAAAFRTEDFKQSRTIQLPECVFGIDEFREIKDGSRLFGINDPDISMERIMGSDLWLSPFSSDVITTRTVSYSWFDLARSFTLTNIQFDFNINTHRLKVIGHTPLAPVVIRAFVAIDEADLYDDYYFQRWCICRCKQQIHRLTHAVTANMVGGTSISTIYGDEAKEEMDQIKEYIKGITQPDWFYMFQ